MQTKAMITLVCVCVCVLVKTRLLTSKTVQIRVSCKAPIPTIGRPFGEKEEEFLDMRLVCYCYYYLFFFLFRPLITTLQYSSFPFSSIKALQRVLF